MWERSGLVRWVVGCGWVIDSVLSSFLCFELVESWYSRAVVVAAVIAADES